MAHEIRDPAPRTPWHGIVRPAEQSIRPVWIGERIQWTYGSESDGSGRGAIGTVGRRVVLRAKLVHRTALQGGSTWEIFNTAGRRLSERGELPSVEEDWMNPPHPFGAARAAAIWAQRGAQHDLSGSDMSTGEHSYVWRLWRETPGYTCWMDAFFAILNGQHGA